MPGRQSIPEGEVVLAVCPPFFCRPWMPAGIPLLLGRLAGRSLRGRVARLHGDDASVPSALADEARFALWRDPALDLRLAQVCGILDQNPAFTAGILEALLAGPERVFGFSTWRVNSALTLEVARRLKAERPGCCVILGGPEATEVPDESAQEWVDVVVSGTAWTLIAPVVEACLEDRLGDLAPHPGLRVNAARRTGKPRGGEHASTDTPSKPIPYRDLVPLFVGDPRPRIPTVLNTGCPNRCAFCSNKKVYPRVEWGTPARLLANLDEIVEAWTAVWDDSPPPLEVDIADAALNVLPQQFDEICDGILAANWPLRLSIGGSFVMDGSVTESRARRYRDVGFTSLSFGLESASSRIRRSMNKPATIEEVTRGLEALRKVGLQCSPNIIVGWPDETEAEHHETLSYLEWAAGEGLLAEVEVYTLSRTPAAMDQSVFAGARGERRGVLWRADGPAGSPEVRCRRVLSIAERLQGLVPVLPAIPFPLLLGWMMPGWSEGLVRRWCEVHVDDPRARATGGADRPPRVEAAVPTPTEGRFAAVVESFLAPALAGRIAGLGRWALAGIRGSDDPPEALLVLAAGDERFALQLRPRTPDRPACARSAHFDISYRTALDGRPCADDPALVEALVATVLRCEPAEGEFPL